MNEIPRDTGERSFLHDLASPIGTAIFLLDVIIEEMQERSGGIPDELPRIEQTYAALEKVRELLAERRAYLIECEVPNGESL